MKSKSSNIFLEIYANKFLVLGAMNYLVLAVFNINIIEKLGEYTSNIVTTILYVLIGCAGLYQLSRRDFYLPFLGRTVYPCGNLVEKKPSNATVTKTIKTAPNINVIYWAAEYDDEIFEDPYIAYDKYANSGVVKSDADGNAVLEFRKPQGYKVPYKSKRLKPHVHYRECISNGMLDPIKTLYI